MNTIRLKQNKSLITLKLIMKVSTRHQLMQMLPVPVQKWKGYTVVSVDKGLYSGPSILLYDLIFHAFNHLLGFV